MLVCLRIVYGSFPASTTEMNSQHRYCMICSKSKTFITEFFKTKLTTPATNSFHQPLDRKAYNLWSNPQTLKSSMFSTCTGMNDFLSFPSWEKGTALSVFQKRNRFAQTRAKNEQGRNTPTSCSLKRNRDLVFLSWLLTTHNLSVAVSL